MSEIDVVQGLPPKHKRQRTKFTLAEINVHAKSLSPEHYALLIAVHSLPKPMYKHLAAGHRLPVGTVKSRLNRARTRLLQLLEGAA